jgi:hypothetical protein
MDPLAPIGSLRELAARHRWEMGSPPDQVSLAFLAARHEDPATTKHRMLWYNTYLIHGFELTLCNLVVLGRLAEKAGLDARQAVIDLALDPEEFVKRLKISDWDLVNGFGYTLSQFKNTFSDIVDGILSALTFGLADDVSMGDILDKIGPSDIVHRFSLTPELIMDTLGLDPLAILVEFCDLALQLFSGLLNIDLTVTYFATGDAPIRPVRAKELGSLLGAGYDVAALCEVFEPERQDDVEANATAGRTGVNVAKGATASGELASSGLMTIAFDGRLVSSQHIEFTYQGDRLRDADAWSRKGAVRSVLDLGFGRRVELYSTHLFNGGGILEFDPNDPNYATLAALFPKITPEERLAIQIEQVKDVMAFIQSTHLPDHVAILVGDFNINGNHPPAFDALLQCIHNSGTAGSNLIDLWPFWVQRGGKPMRSLKPRGDTTHPETCCETPTSDYCAEPNEPGTTSRIDFIFIERPKPEHPFVLDITRVRRRPFSRGVGADPAHLSDHLGLDFKLIASPKTHIPV